MLNVKNLSYILPNGIKLIDNLSFNLDKDRKTALIGTNGIGKSTILKLFFGEITPYSGEIIKNNLDIGYFPQGFNNLNFNTVADVFGFEKQIISLGKVDSGIAEVNDYEILEGFWNCAEIITKKLEFFNLKLNLLQDFGTLSGGEKVKVILSSIISKKTNFLMLDEPTNNLDYESKECFYDFIRNWQYGMLVVSHDRELLSLVDKIIELRKLNPGITKVFNYGGNFDNYLEQKNLEENSLNKDYNNTIKELKKQKQQIIKNIEIKNTKIRQGKKNLENSKYMKSALDLKINKSEKKQGKLIKRDKKNLIDIENSIKNTDNRIERKSNIYFKIKEQEKIIDKVIFEIKNLDFSYGDKKIFKNFNFIVRSRDRIAICGKNGSGKSTLLRIIASKFDGILTFLDQEQNFLIDNYTIIENIMNYTKLSEFESRNILAQFLFRTDSVYKKIKDLSSGEKLRVALTCILNRKTDLIILDEPTNNLDLDSIKVLENILNQYNGAIILVSHDKTFRENIKTTKEVNV